MAEKTRQHAYLGDAVVTILRGRVGGRGKTEIRDQFGFVKEVSASDLSEIDPVEPNAVLKYHEGPQDF